MPPQNTKRIKRISTLPDKKQKAIRVGILLINWEFPIKGKSFCSGRKKKKKNILEAMQVAMQVAATEQDTTSEAV